MKTAGIAGIGLIAPGIENWDSGRELLLSGRSYEITAELPPFKPSSLSANERRRTTQTINLALLVAQQAMMAATDAERNDPALTSVFACSGGDLNVVDKILNALCLPGRPVSPTHFHNSVHNAPAGYWSIATQSPAAMTSIAAGTATLSAGLLEAMSQVLADRHPVLFVAYDAPAPSILRKHINIPVAFGIAMLLVPQQMKYNLTAGIRRESAHHNDMQDPGLEQLRLANPAAQCLPLLQQLALEQPAEVVLPYLHGQGLQLELSVND